MSGPRILLMSTIMPQPNPQPIPSPEPIPVVTYIRDLFKSREALSEFDLCYYEMRKVALCAHLLKTT